MVILFTYRSEKQACPEAFGMRKGAQFLRSFRKQWEAKLPTFLLTINGLVQNCAQRKNCAGGRNRVGVCYPAMLKQAAGRQ